MRGGCSRFLIGLSPWWLPHLRTSWEKHMRTRFFRRRSPTRWSPGCRGLIGEYLQLLYDSFYECIRVLEPGRADCCQCGQSGPQALPQPLGRCHQDIRGPGSAHAGGRSSGESPRRWEGWSPTTTPNNTSPAATTNPRPSATPATIDGPASGTAPTCSGAIQDAPTPSAPTPTWTHSAREVKSLEAQIASPITPLPMQVRLGQRRDRLLTVKAEHEQKRLVTAPEVL